MALNLPSALVAALMAQQNAVPRTGQAVNPSGGSISTELAPGTTSDSASAPVPDPSKLTGTIGTMLKQALASGNQARLEQIVQSYGSLPEFIQGNYVQYLPQAMQQNILDQVQTQQTADAAKQQAAALAAQKPSFADNANMARQNGLTWTQADQDAQEVGAPVGFKSVQAQTDYTNMLKGAIAPAGVNQHTFSALSSALKSASDNPSSNYYAGIKNALSTLPANPTVDEQATIKQTLEASAARAIQGGADPQVVAKALTSGLGQNLMASSRPAALLSAYSQVQLNGQQILPLNPQTALIKGNGPDSWTLSPTGYQQLGQLAQQTGNTQFQNAVISSYQSADSLLSAGGSSFSSGWLNSPVKLNDVRAAVNPNDPNLNTGSQSTIDAIRTVGSALNQQTTGTLSASDQLAQALSVLQGGTTAPAASSYGAGAASGATTPAASGTGATSGGSLASKADYPNLWNANGQWIGSTQTNDNPYDPVTNPFGMMSSGPLDKASVSVTHGAPVATYNPATGTWTGSIPDSNNLADSVNRQNQDNLATAMANAGMVQTGPLFGLTAANATAAMGGTGGVSSYSGSSGGGTGTGSGVNTSTGVPVAQAQTGLGGGPGTTYSETANGALPAPFDIANAQTNNAAAQSLADAYSAQMQHALNNPNQITPLGNLTYRNTGTEANPIWTAISSNAKADQDRALAGTLAGQANVSQLYQNSLNPALAAGLGASQAALENAVMAPGVTNYDVMSQDNINAAAGRLPTAGGNYMDPATLQKPTAGGNYINPANLQMPIAGGSYLDPTAMKLPEAGGSYTDPTTMQMPTAGGSYTDPKSLQMPTAGGSYIDPTSLQMPIVGGSYRDPNAMQLPTAGGNYLDPTAMPLPTAGGNYIDPTTLQLPNAGGSYLDPTKVQGYADQNNPTNNLSDFSKVMTQAQNAVYENFTNLMEPGYQQQHEQLRSQLLNQGLQEGSEAYQTAMDNLARQQNYARTTAANNAVLTGNQTGLAQAAQLAANQGQSFTQQASALQQALTGQLTTNQQNFDQGSSNYLNSLQGLNSQLATNQQNFAQGSANYQNYLQGLNAQLATNQQNFNQGTTNYQSYLQGLDSQLATNQQNFAQGNTNYQNSLQALAAQLAINQQNFAQGSANYQNSLQGINTELGINQQNFAQGTTNYQNSLDALAAKLGINQQNFAQGTTNYQSYLQGLAAQLEVNQQNFNQGSTNYQNSLQGLNAQLATNQQNFTQNNANYQNSLQALAAQLAINQQNFTQGSTNYQNLYNALVAQGQANQANQAANQTAKSSTAIAVNAGLTPLSNLATTVAGLSAPTMQNFGNGTATNIAPTQITTAMQNQTNAGLNNSNALIQALNEQQYGNTLYNIDANGNSWLS